MAVRRFDNALDKLKPDLAKLARDIASQKQKSKGNSTGVAAAMAEARQAQTVERRVPAVRAGAAGDRQSTRTTRTELVHTS